MLSGLDHTQLKSKHEKKAHPVHKTMLLNRKDGWHYQKVRNLLRAKINYVNVAVLKELQLIFMVILCCRRNMSGIFYLKFQVFKFSN